MLGIGDVRPRSAQKIYFPNLHHRTGVTVTPWSGLSPALPAPSYADELTLLGVPQISFQLSGLLLFLIKGKLISKPFLAPKASEYSLNVYFLDFNSL